MNCWVFATGATYMSGPVLTFEHPGMSYVAVSPELLTFGFIVMIQCTSPKEIGDHLMTVEFGPADGVPSLPPIPMGFKLERQWQVAHGGAGLRWLFDRPGDFMLAVHALDEKNHQRRLADWTIRARTYESH